ncbi:hypothetical protein Patl1_13353 [Pistacia atlantica]|uniref:Uncharacterized protein n=1 Tax=Pistacia atlantica TaxID=434234 RepID=A0ACC1AVS9_9ROSI|nr:hypothetical protein Patl1_13353 [Pistacia atlantica]
MEFYLNGISLVMCYMMHAMMAWIPCVYDFYVDRNLHVVVAGFICIYRFHFC